MPDDLFSRGGASGASADANPLFPSVDAAPSGGAEPRDSSPPGPAGDEAAEPEPPRRDFLLNIPVRLSVELGRAEIPIREVLNIDRGAVIELDRSVGQPLDVRVNGVLIGHGEIVVVDGERLGLRFVDVVSAAERATRLT
jgi:flagellar motor switch protein FliN